MSNRLPFRSAIEPSSVRPGGSRRGFTLVETMVVVAILGVLAALGFGALGRLRTNGAFSASVNDVLSAIRQTRAEAFGRGAPAIFVVDRDGRRWWAIADMNANFSLDTFDPATPAPSPDVLVTSGSLPSGVAFDIETGLADLPTPFKGLPASTACSFCKNAAPNLNFGAITFRPGGGAIPFGGDVRGASLTLKQTPTRVRKPTTIVVNARTGATQLFERTTP